MKEDFVKAIHDKRKVRITFLSKEDQGLLTRLCAPMDFGPSRRATDKSDRHHLWDYESDKSNHVLSLLPNQIHSIEVTDDAFDPSQFITWDTKKSVWFIERNWGEYS